MSVVFSTGYYTKSSVPFILTHSVFIQNTNTEFKIIICDGYNNPVMETYSYLIEGGEIFYGSPQKCGVYIIGDMSDKEKFSSIHDKIPSILEKSQIFVNSSDIESFIKFKIDSFVSSLNEAYKIFKDVVLVLKESDSYIPIRNYEIKDFDDENNLVLIKPDDIMVRFIDIKKIPTSETVLCVKYDDESYAICKAPVFLNVRRCLVFNSNYFYRRIRNNIITMHDPNTSLIFWFIIGDGTLSSIPYLDDDDEIQYSEIKDLSSKNITDIRSIFTEHGFMSVEITTQSFVGSQHVSGQDIKMITGVVSEKQLSKTSIKALRHIC